VGKNSKCVLFITLHAHHVCHVETQQQQKQELKQLNKVITKAKNENRSVYNNQEILEAQQHQKQHSSA